MVLDIIVATGLVSNMTTRIPELFTIHRWPLRIQAPPPSQFGGRHLHGEIVALGVLCLLTYDGQLEQREPHHGIQPSIGLPVCF